MSRKSVSLNEERHRIRGVADAVWVTDKYVLKIDFNELSAGPVRDYAVDTFTHALNRTRWPRNIEISDPKIENGIFTVEFKRGLSLESGSDAVAALHDFQGRLIGGLYRVSENFREVSLTADLSSEQSSKQSSILHTAISPSMEAFLFCSKIYSELTDEVTALRKNIENEFGPSSIRLDIR